MLFMSIHWPIAFKAHICRCDGGLSYDLTPNHIKESRLSIPRYKTLVAFSIIPALLLSPSQRVKPHFLLSEYSLGDNTFPFHRSLIAIFRIDIYAMYFRLPAVRRLSRPTFAENDNLITMDIVIKDVNIVHRGVR